MPWVYVSGLGTPYVFAVEHADGYLTMQPQMLTLTHATILTPRRRRRWRRWRRRRLAEMTITTTPPPTMTTTAAQRIGDKAPKRPSLCATWLLRSEYMS